MAADPALTVLVSACSPPICFETVTSGETGLCRRRRSNRPGNSQAKGPRDEDNIWKETPRVSLTVSADGMILSGTATDGASMVRSGDGSRRPRGPHDACARCRKPAETHAASRFACRLWRQDGAVRGL